MALKFKYQSKAEIPPEHVLLYAERDGAFVLDAEGVVKGSVLVNAYSNPFAPVKLSVRSICTRPVYRWRSVVSRLPVQTRTRREE